MVSAVLDRAGALTETIKNDYGEDLLVQTQLRNVADKFHILIQVKGTTLKARKDGGYSFSIDKLHVRRWTSHLQPVLVCIYDQKSEKIFAFYPRAMFSPLELILSNRKYLTIRLNNEDIFNDDTALKFMWRCRTEYFSNMLACYENMLDYSVAYGMGKQREEKLVREARFVIFEFFRDMGIIEYGKDEVAPEVKKMIANVANNFTKLHPEDVEKGEITLREVFMLALVAYSTSITEGNGIPHNLLERGTDLLGEYIKVVDRVSWNQTKDLVPTGGWLEDEAPKSKPHSSKKGKGSPAGMDAQPVRTGRR